MTQQQPESYTPQPPVKPKKRTPKWLAAMSIGIVVLCVFGIVFAAITDSDAPVVNDSPDRQGDIVDREPADNPPPEPHFYEPAIDDFELSIKTLSKECFGSAGCIIEFRMELAYLAVGRLDPGVTYEITYEIHGGEDPYINTLTTTGDRYSTEETERINTPSADSELTVEIVDLSDR